MQTMRIGHFSDIHLLSLKGARWVHFLSKRWIGGLNLLTNRSRHYRSDIFEALVADLNTGLVDHAVATGDITNVALEGEFAFARDKFDAIELGPDEVTVIPGNHDAYVDEGREHFEAYFGDYFRPDADFDRAYEERWPVVRVRGRVAIIGLSTSLETPWFTAYGEVGAAQRGRLASVLSDPRLAGCFRLVAIHHPPAGKRAEKRHRGLRDHVELAEIIRRAGAELVLHGHEHEDVRERLEGPDGMIPVRGIQSGTYDGGKPGRLARYRIYEIAAAGGDRPEVVGESLRVWDPASSGFVDEAAEAVQVAEPA